MTSTAETTNAALASIVVDTGSHSYRSATIGSTFVARLAGK